MLDGIKDKVFDYNDDELKVNVHTMMYKPFSLWSLTCQSEYSTEDVSAQGALFSELSDKFLGMFIVVLVLFCYQASHPLLSLFTHSCPKFC